MALGWTDLTPEGKKYFAELEKLCNLEVAVGLQSDSESYEDGTTLPEVACFNELGTSTIPPRPFMRQSWENHEDELRKGVEEANNIINKGGTAEQAAKQVGVLGKGLVQSEIVDGGFAPNAPSTIARKGSSTPLIDSGHMRQSIQYVIREKGSDVD